VTSPIIQLKEIPLGGAVPRFEVPEWRERFGVIAGITGRGEGRAPFDLGLWTREPVGEVMTRWRAFREAEPGFGAHILGTQIHQTSISWHDEEAQMGWVQIDGVDGHATNRAGQMLLVTVADCIPVYLMVPGGRAIALLHAGWRGTAGGILERGIKLLVNKTKCSTSDIIMHCGVGICDHCYEVGHEVMDALGIAHDGAGPWRADLRQVLVDQARKLGLTAISTSPWCSGHDRSSFFSHRASGGKDGRMVAYLGLTGSSP
jgi:YfiH family protein